MERPDARRNEEPVQSRRPQADLTDQTIINTPRPQATSTVDRRSLVQGKCRRSNPEDLTSKQRQLNFDNSNDVTQCTEQSSLGILQNISTCTNLLDESAVNHLKNKNDLKQDRDRERELALRTLKKCNDFLIDNPSKSDKENNVNSSNLPKVYNVNNNTYNTKPRQSLHSSPPRNKQINDDDKKSVDTESIVFEPSEMAGRSSEFTRMSDKSVTSPLQNFSGISYNSNLAEIMAQFGDEEFVSGSKAGSQIMADELSWRKNQFSSISANKVDNERLELSCFSGIIGSGDLSIDDGRVSAGEFFMRKCGNIGHLSTTSGSERPSFGLDADSPEKQQRCQPLIDQTLQSEASCLEEKGNKNTETIKDPSVMSLSTIDHILQNMDSVTPMKLVDQLIDANKKKKNVDNVNQTHKVKNLNQASDTYTLLPSSRPSLPVSANAIKLNGKAEKDFTHNFSHKLSLDSKTISNLDNKTFDDLLNAGNVSNQNLRKLLGMDNYKDSATTNQSSNRLSLEENFPSGARISSIPRDENSVMPSLRWKLSQLSHAQDKFEITESEKDVSNFLSEVERSENDATDRTLSKNDSTLKEQTITSSSVIKDQSFDTKKVAIGKKTQELCTCLVGVPREADFELYNGTDRWILCSLQLYQIQGEKDNIELALPNNDILIEPDKQKSFKIGVRMPKMGKLVIVVLHIPCSDMVTKTSWFMKHVMCFVPEEPNIKIFLPSNDDTVDFQMITEDTNHSLPITIENKNSVDVPLILRLTENKHQLFNINDCFDDSVSSTNNQNDSINVILKPRMPLTIHINFRGMSLHSFGEKVYQKGIYNAVAKLNASICFKENEECTIKTVNLKGTLGSCKLDVVDTQFPLVLQPKVSRLINVKNSGCMVVTATVDVVQSKEDQSTCRDFFIGPNNIILNEGDKLALQITYKPENNKTDTERHAMIRIIVGNKISFYPITTEKLFDSDSNLTDSYNLQRSETPQCLRSLSSPTSPQSLAFNRSGNSGRQSPCSTASGSTAVAKGMAIPIRATHPALVWGSMKIGKSDTKQFNIRNTSNSKIKLYVTIKSESQSFKFFKDRHTLSSSMVLSLQAMESKTLFVVFTPYFTKAAAGKIIFQHYSMVKESRELSGLVKAIQLFGYGGYGKIEITEAVKDTSGQMWLSLGKLNSDGILHSKIKISNTGDLPCFVKAKLSPKALYPSVTSSWLIEPSEILLNPNQVQWITLEFRPRKEDLSLLQQTGVIHVGTLKLTHGDEPTRLRIRRLFKKLKDSDQLFDKVDGQMDEFKDVIQQITKVFPNETFIQDLKLIGDSVQNLGDLCKGIIQNEVKLTVENQADETMSVLQDNMEESQMFYSLCSDHDNTSHFGGESFLPTE